MWCYLDGSENDSYWIGVSDVLMCVSLLMLTFGCSDKSTDLSGTVPKPLAMVGDATDHCPSNPGQDYAGQTIHQFNFSACDPGSLVGSNFSDCDLSGSTFANADLTNANFSNSKLGPTELYPAVSFNNAILTHTKFSNASMPATNFEYAVIHCTDFSNSNLIQAKFGPVQNMVKDDQCRTNFSNAILDVNLITDTKHPDGRNNWGKSDFSYANFQNLNPANVNFRGEDISNTILIGTNFTDIDFTGGNISNVKFSSANLTMANFTQAAINGADFSKSNLTNSDFTCAQGYGNEGGTTVASGAACPKAPMSESPAAVVLFTNSKADSATFTGANLSQANFSGASVTRGVFINGNLEQANFQSTGTGTSPALVKFGQFDGALMNQAGVASVDFSGCSMIGTQFKNTTFNSTNFAAAILDSANFSNATLQATNFSSASLKSTIFAGATISQPSTGGLSMDFSCAQAGGADFSNTSVKAGYFNNAVMVAQKYCCEPKVKGAPYYCGIDSVGNAYAETRFPDISGNAVKCPDGSIAQVSSATNKPESLCPNSWRLSPNWITSGCSTSGVRTMWAINCSDTPGDIVVFKDPALKKCILQTLPGQTEVLKSTAETIKSVNCQAMGITDIGGLEYFTSMHSLDLSDNKLVSFDLKLENISADDTVLTSLNLESNALTQLDLTSIASIEFLNVSNNRLNSINLNANTYLYSLSANHNALTKFDLAIQSTLFYVDLSGNKLTNVLGQFSSNLSALTSLSYLDLSDNALLKIGSIKGLAYNVSDGTGSLRNLFLNCNPGYTCADLDVYDGSTYPAAASSGCSVYVPAESKWVPQVHPACP